MLMTVLRPLSMVIVMLNRKASATITMPTLVNRGCSRNSLPMVARRSLPVMDASVLYGTSR